MYSKAKIFGHPIHPMMVAFPMTFYTTMFIAFVMYRFFYPDLFWYKLGYFSNFAGVITAFASAVPGFIDWAFGIPKASAAKKRGLIHMIFNVAALILFIISAVRLYGTWDAPLPDTSSLLILSLLGVLLTMIAGYHGWELIGTHKVGVTLTPQQEKLEPVEKMNRKDHQVDSSSII